MAEPIKVAINSARIQFFLGIVAVAVFFWQGVTFVNDQTFRTAAIERKIADVEIKVKDQVAESNHSNEKLLERLDRLNDQITQLALAIRGQGAPK